MVGKTLLRMCEGWPDGRQRLIRHMGQELRKHPDLTLDDFLAVASHFAYTGNLIGH